MGQKSSPISLRLGISKDWNSKFHERKLNEFNVHLFHHLQVETFIKRFFEKHGIYVYLIKHNQTESSKIISLFYYLTPHFLKIIKGKVKELCLKQKKIVGKKIRSLKQFLILKNKKKRIIVKVVVSEKVKEEEERYRTQISLKNFVFNKYNFRYKEWYRKKYILKVIKKTRKSKKKILFKKNPLKYLRYYAYKTKIKLFKKKPRFIISSFINPKIRMVKIVKLREKIMKLKKKAVKRLFSLKKKHISLTNQLFLKNIYFLFFIKTLKRYYIRFLNLILSFSILHKFGKKIFTEKEPNLQDKIKLVLSSKFKRLLFTLKKFLSNTSNLIFYFSCMNKNFDLMKYQNMLLKSLRFFRRFKNSKFYKEGLNVTLMTVLLEDSAEILARFISKTIASTLKRQTFFIYFLKFSLSFWLKKIKSKSSISGIKISIKGRINGRRRARKRVISIGNTPLHSFNDKISYANTSCQNTNGSYGIKVWIIKKF